MLKRAIVVGASSGIGAALVRKLVQHGYKVAVIARREEPLRLLAEDIDGGSGERVVVLPHDVRRTELVNEDFNNAVSALGGLDALVYSAGIMPKVEEDQFDSDVDRDIIEINVIGAMAWLNAGARRFQEQKNGILVGIGSVAGERGRRGNPAYGASKAALHSFMESLRNRLSRYGVRVVTIKPGPVKTPMTEGLGKLPLQIEATQAADQIFAAMHGGLETKFVPAPWGLIMPIIRMIPSVIFRRMSF